VTPAALCTIIFTTGEKGLRWIYQFARNIAPQVATGMSFRHEKGWIFSSLFLTNNLRSDILSLDRDNIGL